MTGTLVAAAAMSCSQKADETLFLKTRMCTFFAKGKCRKGAACSFAHESQELKPAPNLLKTRPCFAFLRHGHCRDEGSCQYAHSSDELRASSSTPQVQWPSAQETLDTLEDDGTAWSRQTTGEDLELEEEFDRQVSDMSCWSESFADPCKTKLVENEVEAIIEACRVPDATFKKTRMCKFFLLGKCVRGSKCNFAHDNDLKPQPNLFRTKPCLAFMRSGKCRDGDACKYAHSRDEMRAGTDTPYTSGTVTPSVEAFTSETDSCDGEFSRLSTSEGTEDIADFSVQLNDGSMIAEHTDSDPVTEHSSESESVVEQDEQNHAVTAAETLLPKTLTELACSRLRESCASYGLNIYVKNTFLVFEERERNGKLGSSERSHSV